MTTTPYGSSPAAAHVPGLTARLRLRIYDHVFEHPGCEVGGVFVGTGRPGETPQIIDIVPALHARGDLTSLTFTHEAWQDIHDTLSRLHPDRSIVGWYHSHPGHGVFLSEQDLFIHQYFFADETSVALVVDPVRGEEGVFGWRDGRIVQLSAGETLRGAVAVPSRSSRAAASHHRWRRPYDEALDGGYPLMGYVAPGFVGMLLGILLALLSAS